MIIEFEKDHSTLRVLVFLFPRNAPLYTKNEIYLNFIRYSRADNELSKLIIPGGKKKKQTKCLRQARGMNCEKFPQL